MGDDMTRERCITSPPTDDAMSSSRAGSTCHSSVSLLGEHSGYGRHLVGKRMDRWMDGKKGRKETKGCVL